MKKLALAAAAAAFFAAPANAQPPPVGWLGGFPNPSILCDTSAQVQSILTAFEEGVEAGQARFVELYERMNHLREPTCAITGVRMGLAIESQTVGWLEIGGKKFYGWIIHIENGGGNAYYLYLETPKEALKNSI